MNKDVIKFALLGAAGWFAYQKFSAPAATPTPLPATTTPPATTPAATTPPPAPANEGVIIAARNAQILTEAQAAGMLADEVLRRAAWDVAQASEAKDYKQNWHQWNFYRNDYAGKKGVTPRAVYAPEDVGMGNGLQLITAAAYHQQLASKGLSGYSRHRGMGCASGGRGNSAANGAQLLRLGVLG